MSTLHLNLVRIWFNMIFWGDKREEYREITPYFCSKFLLVNGDHWTRKEWLECPWFTFDNNKLYEVGLLKRLLSDGDVSVKEFDSVTFSNGMTPPVPRFEIEFFGIEVGEGVKKWGAVKGERYLIIKLGALLDQQNIK